MHGHTFAINDIVETNYWTHFFFSAYLNASWWHFSLPWCSTIAGLNNDGNEKHVKHRTKINWKFYFRRQKDRSQMEAEDEALFQKKKNKKWYRQCGTICAVLCCIIKFLFSLIFTLQSTSHLKDRDPNAVKGLSKTSGLSWPQWIWHLAVMPKTKTRNELPQMYFYNIPRKEGFFYWTKKWENNYTTVELKIHFIKRSQKSLPVIRV